MNTLLAGDIGGTHTRLALFNAENPREPLLLRVYQSGDFPTLPALLERFRQEAAQALPHEAGGSPHAVGLAIAGPVRRDMISRSNLPWPIVQAELKSCLNTERVRFLNDFEAICHAVPHLTPDDLHQIGGGAPQSDSPKVVLGAGTGLGVGYLVPDQAAGWHVVPSEGGHIDFAARNKLEARLLASLSKQHERVYWELLLSGQGLARLYAFLKEDAQCGESRERYAESPAVRDELAATDANGTHGVPDAGTEDPAAVITAHALAGTDPLCQATLSLFCSLYGSHAGNLAITVLAQGGVYLAGGIAGRILPLLEQGEFRKAFESKPPVAFLRDVPAWVITHPHPGLTGAALAALRS